LEQLLSIGGLNLPAANRRLPQVETSWVTPYRTEYEQRRFREAGCRQRRFGQRFPQNLFREADAEHHAIQG